MTIRHHPHELHLTQLAAGLLDPALGLVVQAHVDRCPSCEADIEVLTATGGVLLEDLPPTALGEEALAHTLARIDAPEPVFPALPSLRRHRIAGGIWYRPLYHGANGARAYELNVPAGRQMPEHSHSGQEWVCVLQGSFADSTGRYGEGDFVECGAEIEHSPKADADEDCLCLIASTGPMRMRGLVPRAFQLFLRL
ncbi:MAG: cupin domain-containing protein [Alphaproteobacteria bacterium]|nr:cupin domain-containing protein [Alphaproteobacteria bacterium]